MIQKGSKGKQKIIVNLKDIHFLEFGNDIFYN